MLLPSTLFIADFNRQGMTYAISLSELSSDGKLPGIEL
ncbi:uncharacterized protein METZ01_LOCUS438524, partial [marine metagenome]